MENLAINLASLLINGICKVDAGLQVYVINVFTGDDRIYSSTLNPLFIGFMKSLLICNPVLKGTRADQFVSISPYQLSLLRNEFSRELSNFSCPSVN